MYKFKYDGPLLNVSLLCIQCYFVIKYPNINNKKEISKHVDEQGIGFQNEVEN